MKGQRGKLRRHPWTIWCIGAAVVCAVAAAPRPAGADGVTGFAELNYSASKTETEESAGLKTETETNSFFQRYFLTLDRSLYPNLKLRAGGFFERSDAESSSDSTETDSTVTRISPLVDLTLSTPTVIAGAGYNRREEKQESGGQSTKNIRDSYTGIFGLKPYDLPTLNLLLSRSHSYDKERRQQDIINDNVSLSSHFVPFKGFDVRYQGSYSTVEDKLTGVKTEDLINAGRLSYTTQFFNNRVSVFSSYNASIQTTKVSADAGAGGEVRFPVAPLAGLFSIDDSPTDVPSSLAPTPALVDGSVTTSAGIDLGSSALRNLGTLRNIGLDFGTPQAVDTLFVWVDQPLQGTNVPAAFTWNVYTSSDNITWAQHQLNAPAVFGTIDNRFEITFAQVTTRYIKVVTAPLPIGFSPTGIPLQNVQSILVTELQAFDRRPVSEVRGTTTERTTHVYDLGSRVRLLDTPLLYYDFYYWYSKAGDAEARYIISNGLSVTHRFSTVFAGSARAAREDGKEPQGDRISYNYSASLIVTPLPTLSHTLTLSRRDEEIDGKPSDSNSVFLSNSAELYPGVSLGVSGGYTEASDETGRETKSTLLNAGATLTPHRSLSIGLGYSSTTTDQTGGPTGDTSTYSRRGDLSIAYSYRTVYLFAAFGILSEKDRETTTTQSYAINWSPFRDGTLQFSVSYNESIQAPENSKSRTFTPSLRWNIARRTYLDIAYQRSTSEATNIHSKSDTVSTTLRTTF